MDVESRPLIQQSGRTICRLMTTRDATLSRRLKCAYLNIGGLTENKFKFLMEDIEKDDIDVLGIAETWRDTIPWLSHYRIVAVKESIRLENSFRRKEGMIIIAKKHIDFEILTNFPKFGIGLKVNNGRICFIYKSPKENIGYNFISEEFLKDSDNCNDIIFGDFNCKDGDKNEEVAENIFNSWRIRKIGVEGPTFIKGTSLTNPNKVFSNFSPCIRNTNVNYTEHNLLSTEIVEKVKQSFVRYNLDLLSRKKDRILKKIYTLLEGDSIRKNVDSEFNRIQNIFEHISPVLSPRMPIEEDYCMHHLFLLN